MKSHAGAAGSDGAGSRGRAAGISHGPTGSCRSNEQFAMTERMNSRESRPNNLVYCTQQFIAEEFATKHKSKTAYYESTHWQ